MKLEVGVEEKREGKGEGRIMREETDWGRGEGALRHIRKKKVKGATGRQVKGNEARTSKENGEEPTTRTPKMKPKRKKRRIPK